MSEPLLKTRRFLPLFVTQTLGAFNDNLFKNALAVLALFKAAQGGPEIVAMASGIFIAPYLIFSATAGQIADRGEKSRLIRLTKIWEVLLMLAATAGFLTGSLPGLLAVLFGLGVQATFFSPLKYAILPAHLAEHELIAGNGLIEAGTFVGILIGTILGGALILLDSGLQIVSALGLIMALAGLVAAWRIPEAAPEQPGLKADWNLIAATWGVMKQARRNKPVWQALLALSWFWTLGAILIAQFPVIGKDVIQGGSGVVTLLLTMFALGIGFGSVLCARVLKGEVTVRYVPFAALGISIFAWDFAAQCPSLALHAASFPPDGRMTALLGTFVLWRVLVDLVLLAVCGGLFSVPLYATIQERSSPGTRSRMIGANNIANALLIVVGSLIMTAMVRAGMSAPRIIAISAWANLLAVLWMVRIWPRETIRGVLRLYFELGHKVRLHGLENLEGLGERVIYIVNHLSYIDGVLLAICMPEAVPITFVSNVFVARKWWIKYPYRLVDMLLVDPMSAMAVRPMIQAVREGKHLMIFPEGRISRTGALMKIYSGTGMLADKTEAQIVPIHIDGPQWTPLGWLKGLVRLRWFTPFTVAIGKPVRLASPEAQYGRKRREALGRQVQAIMEQSNYAARDIDRPMFRALLDATRIFGRDRIACNDITYNPVSYGRLILGAAVLGRKLAKLTQRTLAAPFAPPPEGMDPGLYAEINRAVRVGVMLPNASGALVTLMALQAFGRVPAMLNVSAGSEAMLDACRAARAKHVVTSRAFIAKAKLEAAVERMERHVTFIWLEDVRAGLTLADKLRGKWDSRFPYRLPGAATRPDVPAAMLFTSGTTGAPKAILLSHRNILANWAQASAVVDFHPGDRVLNAMPMFHSFGLTGGTLLPLLIGACIFFYPSPLHYRMVPEAIYDFDSTIVFGTDTFLNGWARYANDYDFHTVRLVFAGAEKLREATRALYFDRFGIRVMEAYGATETAPALCISSLTNYRRGSVGRVLPGIEARLEKVEDVDGSELWVRGPNVMIGYVHPEAPDVIETPPGGWYDTGDVVTMDAEGFVRIVGRIKRFAKPGGERISLDGCEELVQACWPKTHHAVVAVPDPRKGEALVLVTTQPDATPRTLLDFARARGIGEIMVPRQIRVVDKLPLLGSGKIAYPAIDAMLAEDEARKVAE
jgi:acyl-[acyl-carrier-protein]-phospholipid O-acyltransferase / long-chain-fatty-acid--[acyl-carrier-protein] ligase